MELAAAENALLALEPMSRYSADNKYQDDGKYYRVFSDVLCVVLQQDPPNKNDH